MYEHHGIKLGDRVCTKKIGAMLVGDVVGICPIPVFGINDTLLNTWLTIYPNCEEECLAIVEFDEPVRSAVLSEVDKGVRLSIANSTFADSFPEELIKKMVEKAWEEMPMCKFIAYPTADLEVL